eukprot:scaffold222333_cov30-Tisochrysis_lutea.AAC.2
MWSCASAPCHLAQILIVALCCLLVQCDSNMQEAVLRARLTNSGWCYLVKHAGERAAWIDASLIESRGKTPLRWLRKQLQSARAEVWAEAARKAAKALELARGYEDSERDAEGECEPTAVEESQQRGNADGLPPVKRGRGRPRKRPRGESDEESAGHSQA